MRLRIARLLYASSTAASHSDSRSRKLPTGEQLRTGRHSRHTPTCRGVALAGLVLGGLALGCTPSSGTGDTAGGKSGDTGAKPPAQGGGTGSEAGEGTKPDTATGAPVELHEWGLIGHALRDQISEVLVAAGPHQQSGVAGLGLGSGGLGLGGGGGAGGTGVGQGRGVGKPVIYAHLLGDAPPQALKVSIKLGSGSVYEHWPQGSLTPTEGGESVSWAAEIKPAQECTELHWPAQDQSECGVTFDGYCELTEIQSYKTDDGACIVVDGKAHDHLFYRAGAQFGKVAISAERSEDGSVRVSPVADMGAPAWFVHVRREGATVVATRYSLGPEGIVLPASGAAPGGEAVADPSSWLSQALIDGGLTPNERDAFVRAWDKTLLQPLSDSEALAQAGAPSGLAGSREALLYIMTPTELDRVAKLEVQPAPAAIKRVFLGHIDLAPPPK